MAEESSKKQLKMCLDVEHAKCSICLNIWHDVVTAGPCLHNFCNGCFSEWLRRSEEKHSSVLCPQCRAVVQFVGRNHFLHNIEEDILQTDSSLKRSDEEIALLDSHASVKLPLSIQLNDNITRADDHIDDEEEHNEDISPLRSPQQIYNDYLALEQQRSSANEDISPPPSPQQRYNDYLTDYLALEQQRYNERIQWQQQITGQMNDLGNAQNSLIQQFGEFRLDTDRHHQDLITRLDRIAHRVDAIYQRHFPPPPPDYEH